MITQGIRREVLETILLMGILGAGVGHLVNGRDVLEEVRDLRGDLRMLDVLVRRQETLVGDIERRLKLLEAREMR